ncbi:hypothetical protein EV183_002192 [Coemansia sp. RSA 2336]|nr:hypothetical protein EV183_002192 [Coemansia sp. RSA 2336]
MAKLNKHNQVVFLDIHLVQLSKDDVLPCVDREPQGQQPHMATSQAGAAASTATNENECLITYYGGIMIPSGKVPAAEEFLDRDLTRNAVYEDELPGICPHNGLQQLTKAAGGTDT